MKIVSVKLSFDPLESDKAKVSVKIRVYHNPVQKKYSLPNTEPVIITKQAFSKVLKYHESQDSRASDETRLIYNKLKPHLIRAKKIADELDPFSFPKFKDKFYKPEALSLTSTDINTENQKLNSNVHAKLLELQRRNHAEDRINNGDLFQAVSNSLIRYQKGSLNLNWDDITPEFLANYERWMLVKGKAPKSKEGKPGPASINTVGIYLRQLRTAFNSAIEEGKATRDQYPFKDKFTIPAAEGNPKALDKEHIKLILSHTEEEGSLRQRSLDLWIFTYLCNGINMMDICSLRWANVNLRNREIVFKRQKTIRTRKKNMKDIKVLLNNRTIQIIDRWSGPITANGYVFPFLNDDMTAKRKRAVVDQILKLTNDHMSKIGEGLGIPADSIRTYEARHSFGTILMQAGNVPIKFISDAMGHSSYKTTESYLSRFRDDQIKDYMSNLTNFDNE